MQNEYFTVSQSEDEKTRLALKGEWIVLNVAAIESALSKSQLKPEATQKIDFRDITRIDTSGALLIRKYFPELHPNYTDQQKKLFEFLPEKIAKPPKQDKNKLSDIFKNIGKATFETLFFLYRIIAFTGEVATKLGGCILHPRRFRFASIVRHIDETGLRAIPIVGLLGFLMSMVVSYQAAIQLQKFGASIYAIDLTVISLLREMGVLITAIMFAGRSGSAFAAEIGVMKLREEVDALRIMGVDPIETLVLPRVLALMITLPLLAFLANILGLAGGAIMAQALLDIPLNQYIDRVEYTATPLMFFVGMVKAPIFAFLIAIVCTYQGMNVTGSAESVGRLTTVAVVQSIFIVLLVDALFSILFANMGI